MSDLTDELLQLLLSNCNISTAELDCAKVCAEGGQDGAVYLHWSIHINFCSYLSVCSVAGYCYSAAWRGVNMISRDLRALVTSLRRH